MGKPKKFVVSGVEYTVTIGGSNVKISRPGFATVAPSTNAVAGYSVYDDGEDFAVLPSHVAKWIRKNSWRFNMKKGEQVLRLREASVDDIMEYKAGNGIMTECGVKIWGIKSSPTSLIPHRFVVVLTELLDNHSVSITNSVEEAALEVMETYLSTADPETIVWVEQWPLRDEGRGSLRIPESFDLVHLRFDGHKFRLNTSSGNGWKRLNEQELKDLGIV